MDYESGQLVIGDSGLRGRLVAHGGNDSQALIAVEDGPVIRVPESMMVLQADGSFYVPLSVADINEAVGATDQRESQSEEAIVIPVMEERLRVAKRLVETGRARISKHVETREEVVDEPLLHQDVEIERVPINRPWNGPAPAMRYEADTLVVPLLEEVIVVEKRLVLKEELHIRRVQNTVHAPQTVILRNESVTVARGEPEIEHETRGQPLG